jgi:hypothetical protein
MASQPLVVHSLSYASLIGTEHERIQMRDLPKVALVFETAEIKRVWPGTRLTLWKCSKLSLPKSRTVAQ